MKEEQNGGFGAESTPQKRTWTILGIVLLILALPVLIPLALAVAGTLLALVLALGGGLAALGLGAAGCILALLVGLGGVMFCAVVGIGFGLVMLPTTPGSGLAVTGVSLMALGAGALGCLLVYGCICLLCRLAKALEGLLAGKKRGAQAYEA